VTPEQPAASAGSAWSRAPGTVRALVTLVVIQVVVSVVAIPLSVSRVDQVLRDLGHRRTDSDFSGLRTGALAGIVGGALIGGLLSLFFVYKVLRRRRWAWITMIVFASIGALGALSTLGSQYATGISRTSGLFPIAVLVLLVLTPTRAWVRRGPGSDGTVGYGGVAYPPQAWGQPQQQWGQPPVGQDASARQSMPPAASPWGVPQPPAAGDPPEQSWGAAR